MTTTTERKVSSLTAATAAIRAAGRPLTAAEISSLVVDANVVPRLSGKTPKATVSAQVTSNAKKGRIFKPVEDTKPQQFSVLDDVAETPEELLAALQAQVEASQAT